MKKLALVATTGVVAVGGVLVSAVVASKIKQAKKEQELIESCKKEVMEAMDEVIEMTKQMQKGAVEEVQEALAEAKEVQNAVEETKEEAHELLDMSKEVDKITRELRDIYPIEGMYGSARSLWAVALQNGEVTKEKYEEAEQYYGTRWHYTGD